MNHGIRGSHGKGEAFLPLNALKPRCGTLKFTEGRGGFVSGYAGFRGRSCQPRRESARFQCPSVSREAGFSEFRGKSPGRIPFRDFRVFRG